MGVCVCVCAPSLVDNTHVVAFLSKVFSQVRHAFVLTVEVGPVDLVEEQVQLRRLGLHDAVHGHAHGGAGGDKTKKSNKSQSQTVRHRRGLSSLLSSSRSGVVSRCGRFGMAQQTRCTIS